MKRADRDRLLKLCRDGYPARAAMAKAGLSRRQVEAAGPEFGEELKDAEADGRGVRAGILLEKGLAGDLSALRLGLEHVGDDVVVITAALNRMPVHGLRDVIDGLSETARSRLEEAMRGREDGAPLFAFLRECMVAEAAEAEAEPPLPATGAPQGAPVTIARSNGASAVLGDPGPTGGPSEPERADPDELRREIEESERRCWAYRSRIDAGAAGHSLADAERDLRVEQARWVELRRQLEEVEREQARRADEAAERERQADAGPATLEELLQDSEAA